MTCESTSVLPPDFQAKRLCGVENKKELQAEACNSLISYLILGSPTWTRTRDLRINSPSLYQLSYQGKEAAL